MTDDTGMMSVDFLVGFTIFIVAFIWVATMIPGLFIGLKAYSLDYDAVAYRTSVILVEDPGAVSLTITGDQPWEVVKDKRDITRFGLAASRTTPLILDENKVDRFFNSTDFIYPDDYQKRVIFGDFPYRFNISLRVAGEDSIRSVGDIIPENYEYGYTRRDVKIKGYSNTTIGETIIKNFGYKNYDDVQFNQFSIKINSSNLLSGPVGEYQNKNNDYAYRINPNWNRIIINFTDLNETRNSTEHPGVFSVNLSEVKFFQTHYNDPKLYLYTPSSLYENFTYVNGSSLGQKPPVNITGGNFSMIFNPGYFGGTDKYGEIFINMSFELNPPQQYLNNTHTRPFDYNYHPANVTQPQLRDAVLEVAVW